MKQIIDSTTGYFETRRGRPIGPARRLLTVDEKRERSRAYTRACRAKALRDGRPDNTALARAVYLAYLDAIHERDLPRLTKRVRQILVDAGYDTAQITAQITRANDQWQRFKVGFRINP